MNDFGGLDDKHLASLGRLAVSFGHVEFLTAEILLVFDDEFIVYTSDGVTRQLELIAVLSDERVDDIELKGAIRAWTSRTSQAEESGDARLLGAMTPDEARNSLSTLGFRHGKDVMAKAYGS